MLINLPHNKMDIDPLKHCLDRGTLHYNARLNSQMYHLLLIKSVLTVPKKVLTLPKSHGSLPERIMPQF